MVSVIMLCLTVYMCVDGGSCELVKGVLLHHMHHFGHLYARLVLFEHDQS